VLLVGVCRSLARCCSPFSKQLFCDRLLPNSFYCHHPNCVYVSVCLSVCLCVSVIRSRCQRVLMVCISVAELSTHTSCSVLFSCDPLLSSLPLFPLPNQRLADQIHRTTSLPSTNHTQKASQRRVVVVIVAVVLYRL